MNLKTVLALGIAVVGASAAPALAQKESQPASSSTQASAGQSPDWLRGRWARSCPSVAPIEIGANYVAAYSGPNMIGLRFEATFTIAEDIVIMRVVRVTASDTVDDAPAVGAVYIARRVGDHLRTISRDDPAHPNETRPAQELSRCS